MPRIVIFALAASLLWGQTAICGNLETSEQNEAQHSVEQGLKFLESTQMPDGSWSSYVGVTGLVLAAFLNSGNPQYGSQNPSVAKGLDYLVSKVHPDGGIYPDEDPRLEVYNTSISILALTSVRDPKYADIIRNARDYLISVQQVEDKGVAADSFIYGGIGYSDKDRSDLSNMQWALEALKESEQYRKKTESTGEAKEYSGQAVKASSMGAVNRELFWDRAIVFLQRCQNLEPYNDLSYRVDTLDVDSLARNDGGFMYFPGNSKAGGRTSYGSMTYAGLKSYIHAGLDRGDPRVQSAYKWICANYNINENPELGAQGLFYYYVVMAKTLHLYNEDAIIDTSGVKHDWRHDLAAKLIAIQDTSGAWVNSNGRWWENNRDLVTAYSVSALEWVMGGAKGE